MALDPPLSHSVRSGSRYSARCLYRGRPSTRRYRTRSGRVAPGRAHQFAFPRTTGRTCRKLTVGARPDSAPPHAARGAAPALPSSYNCTIISRSSHFTPGDWFHVRRVGSPLNSSRRRPSRLGTPDVVNAWLRARNPNTLRGYLSDLNTFRQWLGAISTAAAVEALLSAGQAGANLMTMNYAAALVERAWPARRSPAGWPPCEACARFHVRSAGRIGVSTSRDPGSRRTAT